MDKTTISLADAETRVTQALISDGLSETAARSVACALVTAEAEGQVGHGFSRLAGYRAQIHNQKINATANLTCTSLQPAALLIDADCGFAYPALDLAIERGALLAHQYGVATMAIHNSHHCGALSLQVEKIAEHGLIGLMFANTPKAIAPWGGNQPFYGTNPIAFAVPRANGDHLVIDMSLSKVARGKIMHAQKTGTPIPEGWAIDADGKPTTDPNAALKGSMLAFGDAKGSALLLMVEILAAALTGGAFSAHANSFLTPDGEPPRVGQFMLAIKPGNSHDFAQRLEQLLAMITAQDGVRLPGTRRLTARQSAEQNGLTIPTAYLP